MRHRNAAYKTDVLTIYAVQMAFARPNKEARALFDRLVELQDDEARLDEFVEEQRSHFRQVKAVRRCLPNELCDIYLAALSVSTPGAAICGKNQPLLDVPRISMKSVRDERKRKFC